MKNIYLVTMVCLILTSCKKDSVSESERSEALRGGWKYIAITTDRAVDINGDG